MTTSTDTDSTDGTDADPDVDGETDENPDESVSDESTAGDAAEAEDDDELDDDEFEAEDELDDEAEAEPEDDDEPEVAAGGAGSTVAAGALAVVSAGLGLASLTGTWLGDHMSQRQELIGQINSSSQPGVSPEEQLSAIYGTPVHTIALFNGLFAAAALIAAVLALFLPALAGRSRPAPVWVRAVAFGGLVLGVLGLVIAGAMWFDVFTDLPTLPEPAAPAGPTPQPAP